MARIDYEAAWDRLGEYVASKTQHGREGLLVEMQNVAAQCRVPEGDIARWLRLYSVEVDATDHGQDRDEEVSSAADSLRDGSPTPRTSSTERGHDVSSHSSHTQHPERALC